MMAVREKPTLKDDGVVLAASTKTGQGSVHGESWSGVVVPKGRPLSFMAAHSAASKL